jgi:DMSO reductase anchor subunit
MHRVDQMAIKYHREDKLDPNSEQSQFVPELDPKQGFKRQWNLIKLLSSHENAHIAFTLSVQLVMGAFLWIFAGRFISNSVDGVAGLTASFSYLPSLVTLVGLMSIGLFKLNMHLGKPHRFYRGFYNLRYSPVSREIAGVSLFFAGLVLFTFLAFFDNTFVNALQLMAGLLALTGLAVGGYFMYKLYRIEARPFWNHINTATSFIGTGLVLGSLFISIFTLSKGSYTAQLNQSILSVISLGLIIEIVGLVSHRYSLKSAKSEGAASFYEQTTFYGYSYILRNVLLMVSLFICLVLLISDSYSVWAYILLAITTLIAEIIGRALFYVVVIPTTMPGAFFWKNQGFIEHARETGLADMPQMGVAYEKHHKFNLTELMDTIKTTSLADKVSQLKRIVTG